MSVCNRCGYNSPTARCENCHAPPPLVTPMGDTTDELLIDALKEDLRSARVAHATTNQALLDVRAQVFELEQHRDLLLASREFWPHHVREAIRIKDMAQVKASARQTEAFVGKIMAENRAAQASSDAAGDAAFEWAGSIACGWVFDLQRHQQAFVQCAFCGQSCAVGDEIQEHARSCSKHPMSKVIAERDGFRAEAAAAKRELIVERSRRMNKKAAAR